VRLSILTLALLMVGCGGPSRPATAPVTGRVTYAGKPVPLGQIMFYPENGRPAMGTIGADGTYRLMTFVSGDGATPGRYRVTIQAMRVTGPPAPKSIEDELRGGGGSGKIVTEWLVPEKYSRQEATPLTAEVKLGSNTINFDLPAEPGASR
jgi:hypothetical protein